MIYRVMYYGGLGLAIIMFIVSVLLFIKFKIYKIVGDITGITARKAIKEIRENNSRTGMKTYKTSRINSERGKITERIQAIGQVAVTESELDQKNITSELEIQETTLLQNPGEAAVGFSGETTVLNEQPQGNYFNLEVDIMFVNTYESI